VDQTKSRRGGDLVKYLAPFAALGGGLVLFINPSPHLNLTSFPLDDAWTHQVYAESLAKGSGFAYNPGTQEAGFTSPLWVILSAPFHWLAPLGADAPIIGVKALGIILAAWVVWETVQLGRDWAGALGGAVAGVAMAFAPRLLFSALSGMGTLLAVGLWLAAVRGIRQRRWILSGVALSLAPLARPEMTMLWPLGGLAWFLSSDRPARAALASIGRAAVIAVPTMGWVLFCLYANGRPLPNTFYAKADPFVHGPLVTAGLALSYLSQHGLMATIAGWLAVGGFLGSTVSHHDRQRRWSAFLIAGGGLIYALGMVASRDLHPSGYYWTRWVDPAALWVTAAASAGLGACVAQLGTSLRAGLKPISRIGPKTAWAALVLGALLVQSGPLLNSWLDRREHLTSDTEAISQLNVAVGLWLREHANPKDAIAVNDAGAIRYFSQRKTLDLLGLNHGGIALGRVDRKVVAEDWGVRWLAIFPPWFADSEGQALLGSFQPRIEFSVPRDQYTVCDCPTQTRIVVFERIDGPGDATGPGSAASRPLRPAVTSERIHTARYAMDPKTGLTHPAAR